MTSRFDQKTFCSARVPKISIAKTFDYRRPLFIRNSMKNLARNSVVWTNGWFYKENSQAVS